MRTRLRAYYVLVKPGIIRGNVLHVLIGALVARPMFPEDAANMVGVVVGTILVIASACVFNNITDRPIDAAMKRTKARPLVTGEIRPRSAAIYAAVLGALGFGMLALTTNWIVVASGVLAFVSYVWWYAVAKRASVHGTLVGALPGALPVLAGYSAVRGVIDGVALLLFVLIFVWQLPHFYAISVFRKTEYEKAGLPVAGVVWPFRMVQRVSICWIVMYLALVIGLMVGGAISVFSGMTLFVVAVFWLYTAIESPRGDESRWAKRVFGTSLLVTLTLLAVTSFDFFIGWQLYGTL